MLAVCVCVFLLKERGTRFRQTICTGFGDYDEKKAHLLSGDVEFCRATTFLIKIPCQVRTYKLWQQSLANILYIPNFVIIMLCCHNNLMSNNVFLFPEVIVTLKITFMMRGREI